MARKLSARERRRLFEELFGDDEDEDEKEDAGPGRLENVNVTIDLGDEAAVKRGLDLGFLTLGDIEDAGDEDGDDDKEREPDKAPKRERSYFKS